MRATMLLSATSNGVGVNVRLVGYGLSVSRYHLIYTLAKVMHENTAPLTLTRLGLHVRQGALNRLRPIANALLSRKASRRREKRLRLTNAPNLHVVRIVSGGNGGSGRGGGGRKAWRMAYTRATRRLRCNRGTSRGAPLWTRHTTHAQQTPISGWRDQSATSAVHWNEELDKRRNGGRGVERGCGAARTQPQREASKTLKVTAHPAIGPSSNYIREKN